MKSFRRLWRRKKCRFERKFCLSLAKKILDQDPEPALDRHQLENWDPAPYQNDETGEGIHYVRQVTRDGRYGRWD